MGFEVITINEEQKWNKIVKSFKDYDVFYLSKYAKSFQLIGQGEPLLFYYKDNTTRAINVVMMRDISKDKYFNGIIESNTWFDLSTPYGYGGFIIEGDNYEAVNKSYDKFCLDNNIVCEFVRFNLFSNYEKKYNGTIETRSCNVIRNLDIEPEKMLMDFEHKVRKNLKKANLNNLKIEIDTSGKSLESFLDIYYKTMDRNKAQENFYFKKEFFEILNSMKDNITYFNVIYENIIISTELVIYSQNQCYSYLGGTLSEFFYLRPNEFIKYEIIKWAYTNNIKNFVLGGGYGKDDGIFKYKKSFAPNGVQEFYIGKKIINKKVYDMLVNLRLNKQELTNLNYFPLYRG